MQRSNRTRKTTLRSERWSALKNALTEPTLLEMPGSASIDVPLPDLEQVRKRVEELLEKRQKKMIVEQAIVPGSEAVQ